MTLKKSQSSGPEADTLILGLVMGSMLIFAAPESRFPVVHVLIAIATIEVAATLLLLPWAWGDYLREHGEVAVYMTTKFVGHAAGAVLLLWAGRRDWRTWLLGIYCLLKATQAPLLMIQAFVLELPPPPEYAAFLQHLPAPNRLFVALYVPAFLFASRFCFPGFTLTKGLASRRLGLV